MSQFFTSSGQSIEASALAPALASALVLLMTVQGSFPLGVTDLIFLQSKGLSRVISSTTIRRHQFFGAQPSLWPSSYICTKP